MESLFGGAGKARAACRAVDWARTPLGPVSGWSASLCTTVRLVLGSHFPMIIFWGPAYIQVYNDAFAPSLGEKTAAGRPGSETWAEVWDFVGGDFATVRRTGEASYSENLHYELNRRGFVEETYFTYSHSPLYDAHGVYSGNLSTNVETTGQVLAQRRLDTLRLLAATASEVETASDACEQAAHALAENRHDLPFGLVYLVEPGSPARLAAATGIDRGTVAAPESIDTRDEGDTGGERAGWPIGRVTADGEAVVVHDLDARFPGLRAGPWPESPRSALLLPLRPPAGPVAGVLVAGLSPRLVLDTRYREFLELVAARVSASLAAAGAREAERRRVEMLAELDRAKTEFFSNVSHEFRTPLTLILGPLEQLRSRVREPELRAELDAVHRNGLRMAKLVNTLLDFSRVEAGRADARFEPVDLAVVTEGLASVFRSAMTRAGLGFEVDCAELPEPVYVDRSLWEKVVLNLLSNALKYTLAGSVRVRLRVEGDGVALRVADTGVGIPAGEMSRLFERFHRVEQTRARSSEGSGIGLALAHRLVELHGGTLTATSIVDVGSTFTVTLPLGHAHLPADQVFDTGTEPAPQPAAAGFLAEALRWLPDDETADSRLPGPVTSPPPDAARVLVVDDNADMRDYLRRLLSGRHQVRVVGDGRAALEAVRAELPDLILSDVMLPGIDGVALVRALRSQPATAPVPVVLLSARADQQAAVDGLAAGADDYQVKPFNAADLLARVDSQLRLSRVRREAERQFRALADATPALIWVDGPDGGRRFVNRAWSEFVGAEPGADPAPGWRDHIHPDDRAQYAQVRTRAESRAAAFEVEYRLRSAAGTYRWVLDCGAPLGTADQPRGYVGGCLDVDTRHRERERQRLLAAVTAELNRETTLQGQRSALVRTLVAEDLVDIARVTSIDEAGQSAIRAFAARTDEQRRLLAELRPSVRQQDALIRGPVLVDVDVDEQYPDTTSAEPEQRDIRRRLDIRNSAVIPLSARGRVTEVFAAARTGSSAPLDDAEFALLVEIVERAAISMDNAQLLEHERFTSRRLELLQRATAGLSAAATPAQVAETAVAEFGRLLGTPAVAVFELRGPSLDALTMGGWSADVRRDWSTIPLDAPAPAAVAARRREPVWLELRADWQRDYPDLESLVVDGYGYPGVSFLPMVAGGECLGVVAVGFRTERRMSPSDRAAASALADLCAQALQRAGLLAAENQARRAAEDLSKVVGALSGATSPDEVGAVILGHAADLGATEAAVVLRDGDQLTTLVTSTDGISTPVDLDARHPLAYAARTGQPVWLASRSPLAWRNGGFATTQHELPIQVAVPLVVGRSVVGAIGLHFGTEPPVQPPAARSAILTFAGQCAQALDRARLHQAEHEVAEVLQRSLLPGRLPELARLAVATSYQPAERGTAAGGDWYDLLPIGGSSRVAIAVGDVVGHGAPAAAVMGQLRSSLASYLLDGYGPADALERLDRFAGRVAGAVATTCACLTLDSATGELCYASAGHPPILLLEPGRTRFLDEAGGTVLGVRERAPYAEAGTRILPGATVLLYTDGLVERRREPLSEGLRRLAATAGPLAAMPPDELVAALAARMPDDPAGLDDTAVVAVRLLPEPLRGRMPAAPAAPQVVLQAARRWAELAAVPAELAEELQLTLAEAVADACDHAHPGHLDYEVAHTPDGGIEVSVADQRGRPVSTPDDPARGGRGLQVIRRLAERVEVSTEHGTAIRFRLRPARARRRPPVPPPPAHPGAAPPGSGRPERRTWSLVDDLTAGSLEGARAELRDLLGGPGDVVIDLSAAAYLGSAAMGMLVEANHIAQDHGVRLSVRVARGSLAERAITITNLNSVLEIEWVS